MDAQGRGRAENVDPADQWVLNPQTGDYELRLNPSAGQSPVPGPRRAARRGGNGNGRRQQPQDAPPPQRRRGAEPKAQDPSGPGRRRSKAKKKKSTVKKVLLWSSGSVAFVVLVAAAGGYLYYQHLNGNITTQDVVGAKNGFSKDEAFNILVIGTDKRTGKGNEGYGDKGSVGHADTNILLHVSKDRSNATALSIPRDLIVDVPDCQVKEDDGTLKTIPGTSNVRFNTSLGQDGRDAGCTMKTVQSITGVMPDHFMMADFNAVKTLTSAVNGVEVCVAKDVNDPDSHLKLDAGKHTLEGEDALAFLRTRHSFGNQGDLDRIKAQQDFLGSLARKMSSGDTITNPVKLTKLAEAATKALTVDKGIGSLNKLKDVALEIKQVPTKNLTFVTVPVLDNPADGKIHKTVIVDETNAPPVFEAIKGDISLTETKKKQKAAADAKLKGTKSAASDVRVDIYNGSEKPGAAQATLTWLQTSEGVTKSSQMGNKKPSLTKTSLEYSPDQADQARRLAAIMGLPGSALKEGKSEKNDQGLPAMILVIGKDYKGAGVPLSGGTAKVNAPQKTADKTVCSK
ncbi:LCP family protein [Streptomyces sp. NPDC050085]|uniref:LCP family protein n=1 Tax=Streptomyces sp. NPDC050085 TaxID=3365600 RepID=UPI0037A95FE6